MSIKKESGLRSGSRRASVTIYTDGGARGNPGPGGIGVVIYDAEGHVIKEHKAFLGFTTNNKAEYTAVIQALHIAQELQAERVRLLSDSRLIIEQLNRRFKVRDKDLAKLFTQVWNLAHSFRSVVFQHVRREQNKHADRLANEAMDAGTI
ncbi:MAG: hypothetical protein A3B74_03405 [Candidatus Kerfeldbacteria bacterium RIFCSPHIGHO2_02_FULL_42_14]|uniref:RNase H type-1 domain-containing protein n=1 Tax=Candidatus Kerfeldbacteria bacterium RIFCSPHIGHO2_02_FULL_42_14 TaxID=1798540 RepID=A0A1G2AUB2_9BACT|nr:MAG: hypothetical protein A3B74_03405 [Candidatus Kerfeldbacteria bacterium RIFCSPHIGHO2_02_FULL_42_14]OGY82164.1 MAG: hypothetical protein A3E60_01715 [Candidatus Kerfeldbacteria bacterium RIFCSPHIGHO2_12_FULL_42_13]OGY82668.1 MAG: hypothetical protein A3I91_01165 [Candidatus Kerfeldbacteria bacterium RIFCSPLOWO2_02_FULL_42_19]OGY86317.1 MAG: hypothetical protein A3G01_00740 [Candidatus Kerfeldbacteria bacterium RIFCSPLOWO2_12_FULL_43_9]